MSRFLIEAPHEGTKQACELAVQTFLKTGSHFMTDADWGCSDGEHKAWIVVDLDTKDEAMLIVPPEYRKSVRIIQLEKFALDDTGKNLLASHI